MGRALSGGKNPVNEIRNFLQKGFLITHVFQLCFCAIWEGVLRGTA